MVSQSSQSWLATSQIEGCLSGAALIKPHTSFQYSLVYPSQMVLPLIIQPPEFLQRPLTQGGSDYWVSWRRRRILHDVVGNAFCTIMRGYFLRSAMMCGRRNGKLRFISVNGRCSQLARRHDLYIITDRAVQVRAVAGYQSTSKMTDKQTD